MFLGQHETPEQFRQRILDAMLSGGSAAQNTGTAAATGNSPNAKKVDLWNSYLINHLNDVVVALDNWIVNDWGDVKKFSGYVLHLWRRFLTSEASVGWANGYTRLGAGGVTVTEKNNRNFVRDTRSGIVGAGGYIDPGNQYRKNIYEMLKLVGDYFAPFNFQMQRSEPGGSVDANGWTASSQLNNLRRAVLRARGLPVPGESAPPATGQPPAVVDTAPPPVTTTPPPVATTPPPVTTTPPPVTTTPPPVYDWDWSYSPDPVSPILPGSGNSAGGGGSEVVIDSEEVEVSGKRFLIVGAVAAGVYAWTKRKKRRGAR